MCAAAVVPTAPLACFYGRHYEEFNVTLVLFEANMKENIIIYTNSLLNFKKKLF